MATVTPTSTGVKPVNSASAGDGDYAIITWVLTSANSDGAAVQYPDYADRTVQFTGTFGTATVQLEGSLDGTNWTVLTDPQGNAITKTATSIEAVSEAVPFIRANLSTPGAGATITALLFVRKTK
jgi:hypothetical protein